MSAHDADVQKQVRAFKMVFAALAIFTVLTVAVSTLHLPIVAALVIALLIASVKGSLVAGWFMHLRAERKAIYAVLVLTVAFFVFLLFWPLLDIGGGMGKHSVMEGVKKPWDPHSGHGATSGHAGDGGGAESGATHGGN